jgi:hypothetical protein
MERHCTTERRRTPIKALGYVAVQIDVRDTELALLNYLCASVFASANRINHLPLVAGVFMRVLRRRRRRYTSDRREWWAC